MLCTQGLVGIALAAIDMALWDALARAVSLPLVKLLGGAEKPIRAYGAVGYDGAEGCARAAENWAKRGFTGIKAKIGYATVQKDVAVVRAMRKAAGDDMAFMVDYNQCLTPIEAVERLRVLDDVGLTWVEEPTLAHDYAGHAFVTRKSKTQIQCGENKWGTLDLQHALEARASDFVMPDVMKIGGVTGWLRAAALAQVKGSLVSNHRDGTATVNICDFIRTNDTSDYIHATVQIRIRLRDSWERILAEAEFTCVEILGDWDSTPYDKESNRCLIGVVWK